VLTLLCRTDVSDGFVTLEVGTEEASEGALGDLVIIDVGELKQLIDGDGLPEIAIKHVSHPSGSTGWRRGQSSGASSWGARLRAEGGWRLRASPLLSARGSQEGMHKLGHTHNGPGTADAEEGRRGRVGLKEEGEGREGGPRKGCHKRVGERREGGRKQGPGHETGQRADGARARAHGGAEKVGSRGESGGGGEGEG
jgi:hypothetical protein